ncbi:hypothetical protein ACFOLD_16325 [Kocuria carniphila]
MRIKATTSARGDTYRWHHRPVVVYRATTGAHRHMEEAYLPCQSSRTT